MRWRTIVAAAIGSLFAAGLIACSPEDIDDVEPEAGVTEVVLEDNSFKPRVIEVAPGTEVRWIWNDGNRVHDVKGDAFASEVQSEGIFRYTIAAPGNYDYECTLHRGMTGRVIVTGQ